MCGVSAWNGRSGCGEEIYFRADRAFSLAQSRSTTHVTSETMSEITEDDWRAIARNRWPMFTIVGDGPFVAVSRGSGTVHLFNTILERTTHAPTHSELLTLRLPDLTD